LFIPFFFFFFNPFFFRLFTLVLINEKPPFKKFLLLLFLILGHDNEQADSWKQQNLEGKKGDGLWWELNHFLFSWSLILIPPYY
jgi:hypothetical protein